MLTFVERHLPYVLTYMAVLGTLFVCLLNLLLREFTRLILKFVSGPSIKLMDQPMDNVFASDPQFNIVLACKCKSKTASPIDFYKLAQTFEDRLDSFKTDKFCDGKTIEFYSPYEKLKWTVTHNYLFYLWKLQTNFSAKNHFSLQELQSPTQNIENEIQKTAEFYLNHKWTGEKPQWEIQILAPTSKQQNKENLGDFALILASHHAYGDTTSLFQFIRYILADTPFQLSIEPMKSRSDKSSSTSSLYEKLKFYTLFPHVMTSMLLQLKECLQTGILEPNPSTPLGRRHCRSLKLSLKTIKQNPEKRRITSILLAAIVKAYRRSYDEARSKCPKNIFTSIAYANYPYEMVTPINSFSIVSFPCQTEPPLERGDQLKNFDSMLENGLTTQQSREMTSAIFKFYSWLSKPLVDLTCNYFSNHRFALTNLPGARQNFEILGGHLVEDFWFYGPLAGTGPAVVATVSHGDSLRLNLIVGDEESKFLNRFTEFCEQEIREIVSSK